ncbi:S8 family serine peptidase [Halapricum sp. CBA1109]|uniref:S8 family serine peptidase n=1 Tax=Halapricum sp. CBA1109 TaxID=2668068 RepID=UPI0012F83F19|nr:S8 family serine peptidase [Halapricum sp. CBA1109]MUV89715.1 S8 family serine peptidase [Halapricum sp. CBA1109]
MSDRRLTALAVAFAVLMLTTPVAGAVAPLSTGTLDAGDTAVDAPASSDPVGGDDWNDSADDDANATASAGDRTNDTTADAGEATADDGANITAVEPDETDVVEVDREYDYAIPFRAGTITPEPGLDPAVTDSATARTWVVVQFVAAPTAELLEEMTALGYEDGERLTRTARYANVPVEAAEDIAARDEVRSVLSIRPELRIHPDLVDTASDAERVNVTVTTFEPIDTEGTPLREVEANTYRGEVTNEDLDVLSENPRVRWVEEFTAPAPTVSEGRRLVGAHLAERAGPGSRTGYDGTGIRVGVLDTGIQPNHPHFDDVNIIQGYDWVDGDYNSTTTARTHGQHVAGTIAGNGTDASRGVTVTGVAEDATLIPSRILDPGGGITTVWTGPKRKYKQVNDEGADIISNSWGDTPESSDGDYDVEASKTDTWAYNHEDTLLVFSNGNFNQTKANRGIVPASEQYVGSPALAKNVISVGAVRDGSNANGRVTDASIGTVNADSILNNLQPSRDMADNSNRRKPELYAPGHWTTAPLNSGYGEKLGTSMAAPHVSGVAALLKDKYEHRSLDMDANAMRAELIATAAPPNHDGYGIVNANNALFTNRYEARHAHMSGSVQNSGLFQSPSVEVDKKSFTVEQDTEKLVVALTWLDPGHTPTLRGSGSNILANDLDLEVEGPDGTRKITTNSNVKRLVLDDPSQGRYEIRVRANRVTAFTNQAYDVVYRTVTEEPTLSVTDTQTTTLQPWEDRQRWFNVSVEGTGAPVSGTVVDVEFSDPSAMSQCGDWEDPTVAGILSEGQRYEKDICVEVPSVTRKRTVNATVTVNTSNAASINGVRSRNLTVRKTFELLPPPDRDRFDDFGRDNDRLGTATNLSRAVGWDHRHLFCVGSHRFSSGKSYGDDCSGILSGGGEVFAREYWDTELSNLSLHDDADVDYYDLDVPETDTPTLPKPECGTQNVTIDGTRTEIATEGELVVVIRGTGNALGEAAARTNPEKTPITLYDDGREVTNVTLDWLYDTHVQLSVDCPQTRGLDDLTVSFGEGAATNVGGYEMAVRYRIDVKRVEAYKEAVRDQITDAIEAQEVLENAYVYEQLPGVEEIDAIVDRFREDGRPACYTHCGYPGGPPERFVGERIRFDVYNPQGEISDRFALVTGEAGGLTEFRRLEDPAAFESTMRMETSVFAARLLSTAERPGPAVAAAYRQGLIRFEGPGFLDGLYVARRRSNSAPRVTPQSRRPRRTTSPTTATPRRSSPYRPTNSSVSDSPRRSGCDWAGSPTGGRPASTARCPFSNRG